jgi:hypothetical protein
LEKIDNNRVVADNFLVGFGISMGFHIFLLFVALVLRSGVLISRNGLQKSFNTKMQFLYEDNFSNSSTPNINPGIAQKNKLDPKSIIPVAVSASAIASSPFSNADTTSLTQYYSENSLNVNLKFPVGWTYIDQNVKKKLDGITFYGDPQIYNPPPYVHLEVVEKYLFNPSRYTEKAENSNYEYFYNPPEELEGTFTQTIYIKTDIDEDFIIKLIVKGKEPFYRFLPSFWGIVQSFNFGNSIF